MRTTDYVYLFIYFLVFFFKQFQFTKHNYPTYNAGLITMFYLQNNIYITYDTVTYAGNKTQ